MLTIPFSVLPPKIVVTLSKQFKSVGDFLKAFFPGLQETLLQAEVKLSPREYCAVAAVITTFNTIALALLVNFVGLAGEMNLFAPSVVAALLVGVASFFTVIYYPQIIARRRMRQLENQLIPATRQLLIEIKSGVPLFNAMASISDDYGEVSTEFRKIIKKINSGVPELDALAEATSANPSIRFRKLLWQISNALKVGADLGNVIEGLLKELVHERIDEIRRYGQELSPWAMIYMLASVVLPSLGVTMAIVIMSFLNVQIPAIILPAVLVFLLGFQLFFMNFVSTRRPTV